MAKKVLNFDRFLKEKSNDFIEVTVLGKTLKIKSEIPAIVPIMMARAKETGESASTAVFVAADIMIGKENLDELCEKGLSTEELTMLLQKLFAMINGTDEEEEEMEVSEGEPVESKETPNP